MKNKRLMLNSVINPLYTTSSRNNLLILMSVSIHNHIQLYDANICNIITENSLKIGRFMYQYQQKEVLNEG